MNQDDRILPQTRWASVVIVVILIPALVFLWGMPDRTSDLWAWTIKPEMTAIFMGSGYGAGAFFFFRVSRARVWHPASAGVLGAAVFAALMLVATLIHWDRFNHGNAPFPAAAVFYGWVVVYLLAPPLVGWLWLRNRDADPRDARDGDPLVPQIAARVGGVIGAGAILSGSVFLVSPAFGIGLWPWPLTPLTARVVACFTVQVGIGSLVLSFDRRWSSWRLLLQTYLVAVGLLAIGTLRAWNDFDRARATTWMFVFGLTALAASVIGLYRVMAARGTQASAQPPPTRTTVSA